MPITRLINNWSMSEFNSFEIKPDGRRDNLYKARIKILVNAIGIGKFRQQVKAEWQQIRDSELRLTNSHVQQVRDAFKVYGYRTIADKNNQLKNQLPGFVYVAMWV